MNITKEIQRINAAEQKRGITGLNSSWHNDYKDTSWVFVGSLPKKLTEGDIICVFSQWGEIEDIHLVRDEDTGESKGFAFIKYEDWRSTVLAVDNFNGTSLLGRVLRVDHSRYERPKLKKDEEEQLSLLDKAALQQPGHAYHAGGRNKIEIEGEHDIHRGMDVFAKLPDSDSQPQHEDKERDKSSKRKKRKKHSDSKKAKDKHKKKKRKKEKH
eukprot:CAMPEP_0204836006 /NCGR_PEP_ID=MMETSP1346-20131115/24198_1 /ASSEMBLY_ACC=CAM_ASM_000771 /TAXON_ID=215587 /ORGANISM="Aplanochytrium stocchinoi, Strain GSBS06" /LENGTH=212 /DNA_ID=CAMNT_0051970463 /DNA_START=95 /DNA_END=733 /DNA_ORIENTATION=-